MLECSLGPMEIVTVTYSADLPTMLLQAHSLDAFAITAVTHHVYIEDTEISMQDWHQALLPYYTRNQLVLHDGNALLRSRLGEANWCGWVNQQLLKLLSARDVSSERYLVLDSKNLFIKPFDISDWPLDHGNGLARDGWQDRMEQFIEDFTEFSGLPNTGNWLHPLTPWVMYTDVAKTCFDRGYVHYMLQHPVPYEFVVYTSVANELARPFPKMEFDVCAKFHVPPKLKKLSQLAEISADPQQLMISLHNRVIRSPRSDQTADWLCDLGLDRDIVSARMNIAVE